MLTLQFMPDHSLPFGNLSDIATEGFSYDTEMPLDLFDFFIAHGPTWIDRLSLTINGEHSLSD